MCFRLYQLSDKITWQEKSQILYSELHDLSLDLALGGKKKKKNWCSLVTQLLKNLPAMWETWVQLLGWENSLENGTATHSSILVFWPEEFHGLYSQPMGSQRVRHSWATFTSLIATSMNSKALCWLREVNFKRWHIIWSIYMTYCRSQNYSDNQCLPQVRGRKRIWF